MPDQGSHRKVRARAHDRIEQLGGTSDRAAALLLS